MGTLEKILLCVVLINSKIFLTLCYSKDNVARIGSTNNFMFKNVESAEGLNKYLSSSEYYSSNGYYNSYGSYQSEYRWSSVSELKIVNASINKIPSMIFRKLTSLIKLNASEIGLVEIKRDDFEYAKNLKLLNLTKNKIEKLDSLLFMHCKQLVEIDLSENEISEVKDSTFEGISMNIEKVNLSGNKIKSLKEDFLAYLIQDAKSKIVSISLNDNQIEFIEKSSVSVAKNSTKLSLQLMNNKLKAFDLCGLSFWVLNLKNNQIESYTQPISVNRLDISENKLQALRILNDTTYLNADNNEITKLEIEDGSLLEILRLSGNGLGNQILLELKHTNYLKILALSGTALSFLKSDSFHDMKSLEILDLSQNQIQNIDFGVIDGLGELKSLNLSSNMLDELNLHVLGSLSQLNSIDISWNKISKIVDHDKLKQILPQLSSIGLEGNNWDCEYLSRMKMSLTTQKIFITAAQKPAKNQQSLDGISCTTKTNDTHNLIEVINDDKMAEKVNAVIERFNSRLNEVEANRNQVLSEINSLKAIVFDIKSTNLKSQLSSVNATNINEVKVVVEQMNNMTLEKQKLAYDQLVHKINEQNVEISKYRVDTEKLILSIKEGSPHSDTTPSNPQRSGLTSLETVLIVFVMVLLALLATVYSLRKFINSKWDQHSRQRVSRHNSTSTVVTFDNNAH